MPRYRVQVKFPDRPLDPDNWSKVDAPDEKTAFETWWFYVQTRLLTFWAMGGPMVDPGILEVVVMPVLADAPEIIFHLDLGITQLKECNR